MFRIKAAEAVQKCPWQICSVPEAFITEEMVSIALSYDLKLCNNIPVHFLNENLLTEKLTASLNQGFLKDIYSCGEDPLYISCEINEHRTFLKYIPEELRTEKVCNAAVTVCPANAKYAPIGYHFQKLKIMLAGKLETQLSDKEMLDLYKGIHIVVPAFKTSKGYVNNIYLSYNKMQGTLAHSKSTSVFRDIKKHKI